MQISDTIFLYVNLFLIGLVSVGLIMVSLHLRKLERQIAVHEHRWKHENRSLRTGEDRVSQRIDQAEYNLKFLVERLGQLEKNSPGSNTYQYAQHLAGQGAPVEAIVDQCGVSQGEAELIKSLKNLQRGSLHS